MPTDVIEAPKGVSPTAEPFSYALAILMAMNRLPGKHIYAGTVPAATIAKRRKANKRARANRKANRG